MTKAIVALAKNLVNLIYPLHCASCAKPMDAVDEFGVCASCRGRIRRNMRAHFASSGFDSVHSACLYEDVLKELIHAFKYKKRRALSGLFSSILAEFVRTTPGIIKDVDFITFVPLHSDRLRSREFNQSKLLAKMTSESFKIPLTDALDKTKITRSQNELSRDERLLNLKDAFRIRQGTDVAGQTILLMDDVMTTGATLDECARVLKSAGAKEVRCLTLARGL